MEMFQGIYIARKNYCWKVPLPLENSIEHDFQYFTSSQKSSLERDKEAEIPISHVLPR
jgi:hypothetical protein